jgi:hypothetical protein
MFADVSPTKKPTRIAVVTNRFLRIVIGYSIDLMGPVYPGFIRMQLKKSLRIIKVCPYSETDR